MNPMDQVLETAEKISSMEIRGAGRIATAAASSLRDYSLNMQAETLADFNEKLAKARDILLKTRPTAVSLSNALRLVTK